MTRRHIKPVLIGRETIPYDSAWYGEVGGGGGVGEGGAGAPLTFAVWVSIWCR